MFGLLDILHSTPLTNVTSIMYTYRKSIQGVPKQVRHEENKLFRNISHVFLLVRWVKVFFFFFSKKIPTPTPHILWISNGTPRNTYHVNDVNNLNILEFGDYLESP